MSEYNDTANKILDNLKTLKSKDNFSTTVDTAMKDLETIMNKMGIVMAGMSAYLSIKNMFKNKDVEGLIVGLGMDLEGNPTSEMGHLLFKLASYDEFQATNSADEFLTKIKEESYSKEFMEDYREYLKKFGARGFMEIDVATKRVYEDPSLLYEKLININIENSQILHVKTRRKEAYDKLHAIATEAGFAKKFEKQAEIFQASFGYRNILEIDGSNGLLG